MNPLLAAFSESFVPPLYCSIPEYCIQKNVELPPSNPVPGLFTTEPSRYMDKVFESLQDHSIRQVSVMAGVQTGKSLVLEIFVPWKIVHEEGNILWFHQNIDSAKDAADSRINPILRCFSDIVDLLPDDRFGTKKLSINFPHANLFIKAANENSVQSRTAKTVVFDECWLAPQGYLYQAKARTTKYPHTSKVVFASQGGYAYNNDKYNDDFHKEFEKGITFEWGWKCPHCLKDQIYYWSHQREDGTFAGVNGFTEIPKLENGQHDYAKCGAAAYFECVHCRGKVVDIPTNRRLMNASGSYICTKETGDPTIHSFRWNAMANYEIPLSKLVVEYLQAKDDWDMFGYIIPLIEFTQKRLGQSWRESSHIAQHKAEIKSFDPNIDWGKIRVMTVDVQKDQSLFYYSVFALDAAEIRLLDYGKFYSWGEIKAKQTDWNIQNTHVGIDVGNNQTSCAGAMVGYGEVSENTGLWLTWIALKGSGQEYFAHYDKETKLTTRKVYSEPTTIDYMSGKENTERKKEVWLYNWSNYSIKNIAKAFRDGKRGKLVVQKEDPEWVKQMNSEILTKERSKSGETKFIWKKIAEDNHYWDCFCMAIAMGIIAEVFCINHPTDISLTNNAISESK